ncbi:MAG: hypothetical protein LBQ54_05455 [Planctomycetaceae bacterium]|jgi:hypothetical protein|nr:hypothetical protein [Planctomycetaceae bacterium]
MKRFLFLLMLMSFYVTCGCVASYTDRVITARRDFYAGNLESAKKQFDSRLKKGKKKETDLIKLENAVVDMSEGRFSEAKRALIEVRDSFDHLEQKSLAENTLSLWTDDTMVSYPGEDYEKVMIRAFLAICDLMEGGSDAEAFALQVVEKQQQIRSTAEKAGPKKTNGSRSADLQEKDSHPKLAYKQVPFGPYIRGLIREETLTNFDDALRYYTMVEEWEPGFQQVKHDIRRVKAGHHHMEGNGVVYVFTLVGRGPYKERENAEATQLALLIADQIFSATNKYSVPPTLAPVPIPAVKRYFDAIHNVGIEVNGSRLGATETITDIGQMAEEQFEAIRHQIIARAVVRRIVKKGSVYAAKNAADVNPWISLAMDAGGVAWEAMETADTRCWGLLPDRIQVARLELPEGTHTLKLRSLTGRDLTLGERSYPVEIHVRNGYNTYVFANFPSKNLVGRVSVR